MVFNPYAADESSIESAVPEYAMPNHGAYASPDITEGSPYNDEFGWSGKLRTSTVETPSAQRVGAIPRFDMRPNPQRPVVEEWRKRDADDQHRHSVEDQTATGWNTPSGVAPGETRFAPNPRSVPVAESRITSRLAPRSYSFTRFFDQFNRTHDGDPLTGSARTFNGMHFSMADHRRTYDVEGFAPVRSARNTYRIEPTPWDAHIVDMPADNGASIPTAQVRSVEVPSGSRSWRLV